MVWNLRLSSESNPDTAVASTDSDADTRRLLTSHCPFAATAAKHPEVVCSLDRGIVSGLMEGLSDDWRPVSVVSHPEAAEDCVAEI